MSSPEVFTDNRNLHTRGFTLIELLLVVTIFGIIMSASSSYFSRFFVQNSALSVSDMITSSLRKAQLNSMVGRQNDTWGVHYLSNAIVVFKGPSYAARTAAFDETFPLSGAVTVTGLSDVVFTRGTGTPSATLSISVTGNNVTSTITMNAQGTVNR